LHSNNFPISGGDPILLALERFNYLRDLSAYPTIISGEHTSLSMRLLSNFVFIATTKLSLSMRYASVPASGKAIIGRGWRLVGIVAEGGLGRMKIPG